MHKQQSRQILEKRIIIMVANSRKKHEYKTMLEVTRGQALDFVLYCMAKDSLYAISTQSTTWDTLYIIWYLLNVTNICDLLRMAWIETKWIINDMPVICRSYFTETLHSKLPSHLFNKEDGGLAQNWIICIENGSQKNFAQVTTLLGNLYWKHCLLIENVNKIHEIEVFPGSNLNFTIKVFTMCLANDDNIYK